MQGKIQVSGFSVFLEDVPNIIRKVNSLTDNSGVVQLLNADGIAGEEHIRQAACQAIKAFKRHDNIANDLGLEICVRASAQRQISRALEMLGLKKGHNNICAVLIDCDDRIFHELENYLGKMNNEVLEPDESHLKNLYSLSNLEIDSSGGLTRAMIERTSLLVIET
ncbi:MAG TPA: KEOPS complex subunit Cgi121 [Methanobacterium sp.]|nr:KEOPS complex subunit Cgi121 [Methanobacterium sp.]